MKIEQGEKWVCNQCRSSVRIVVNVAESLVTFRKFEEPMNELYEMHMGLFLITHEKIIDEKN